MNDIELFNSERKENVKRLVSDQPLKSHALNFFINASMYKYSYNFDWLGLPIIQFPQDIVAIQEIIWKVKPDFIIETGVARGGSLALSASILHLINGNGKVIGVDIDIRAHNRAAIESHPLSNRIHLIEGSSTEQSTMNKINKLIGNAEKIIVMLDSNHTYDHVIQELNLYSNYVKQGSYLIVLDTIVEDMPEDFYPDRPWGKSNNPKTAVHEFLKQNNRFEIDQNIQDKLLITTAPDGYLKCIR